MTIAPIRGAMVNVLDAGIIGNTTAITLPVIALVAGAAVGYWRRWSKEKIAETATDTKELLSRAKMRKELDDVLTTVEHVKTADLDALMAFMKRIKAAERDAEVIAEERARVAKAKEDADKKEREKQEMEDSASARSGVRTTQPLGRVR